MSTPIRSLALLAFSLLPLAACAPVTSASAPAVAARAESGSTPRESEALCLAPIGRSDAIERALARSQLALHGDARRIAANWSAVGRQWVRKARLSGDPGYYVHADGCAREALALSPDDAAAHNLRALVAMNDHDFESARALAERVLAREPEDATALGTLSDALLELGRHDEAVAAAQRQLQVRPGMAASSRGSYLSWLRGDTRGAKLLIRDALSGRDRSDPEPTAWVLTEAATIYWHESDLSGADGLYAEALNWVPEFPAALVGRARIALAQGRARDAIDLLERAQRARPALESAALLGDALAQAGDAEAARRSYDDALRLGRRGDRHALALFLATHDGDAHEAVRLLEAERAVRGGVYLDDAYAWALYRAGRTDEARRASDSALRLGTPDARLLYHAGAIRIAQGEHAEGRALVERALALNGAFEPLAANEARALLDATPAVMASR